MPERLCGIERGYVQPEPEELRRLFVALDALIAVRSEVQKFALHLGWPGMLNSRNRAAEPQDADYFSIVEKVARAGEQYEADQTCRTTLFYTRPRSRVPVNRQHRALRRIATGLRAIARWWTTSGNDQRCPR